MNVEVNGTRLEYVERGRGEPVVFVHGGISDWRTWRAQLGPFSAAGYRAITYSRRFFWPNTPIRPDQRSNSDLHAADLVAFLEATKAAPAHLVGNSWGGLVVLQAALQRPDLVRTMVLEEPALLRLFVTKFPPSGLDILKLLMTRPRLGLAFIKFGATAAGPAEKLFRQGRPEQALLKFVGGVVGLEAYRALPEERKQQMRDNVTELEANLTRDAFDPLDRDAVKRLDIPTLLVGGERSPKLMAGMLDLLQSLLPRADRVRLAGVSHVMHEEDPAATNEAILAFLSKHRLPSRSPRIVAAMAASR